MAGGAAMTLTLQRLAVDDRGGGTGLPTGPLAQGEKQLSPDRLPASLALKLAEDVVVLRVNLDENVASIWVRRGGRAERQLTMAAVLARL